jgi:hypothetical protein
MSEDAAPERIAIVWSPQRSQPPRSLSLIGALPVLHCPHSRLFPSTAGGFQPARPAALIYLSIVFLIT